MRIEDRLTNEGRRLRENVDVAVAPGEVEAALGTATGTTTSSRRRPLMLVAAAIVLLAAAIGSFVFGDDDERLVADEGEPVPTTDPVESTTVPEPSADITGDVIGSTRGGETGAMAYLGIEDALADRWTVLDATRPAPAIDFDRQAVITFTVSSDARCKSLEGLARDGNMLRPAFRDATPCTLEITPGTFFLAVDRTALPDTFDLVLDSDLLDGDGPYALAVDTSENFASFTPPQPGSSGLPPAEGPDLESPEPGREITFDRIGGVELGQTLGPAEFYQHESLPGSCGYWGPDEPSHDGDEPLSGLVSIDDGTATIKSIMVRGNPRYRTASGVGVGTSLATLEGVYGEDLVIARVDESRTPEGLKGQYGDVAAVRHGDRALTFYLSGDVVRTVKLSNADFWGDDEGCA